MKFAGSLNNISSLNNIDSFDKKDEVKFVNSFNNINLFKAFSNQGARYVSTTTTNILSEKEARAINTNSTPVKPILL